MHEFTHVIPTLDNYWRAVILFGRNVASYKFALAKSLLEMKSRGDDLIRLYELAEPFALHVCEHLIRTPKQATSSTSRFLEVCRAYNNHEVNRDELVGQTVKLGFNNVIKAFHVVNREEIPERFFLDERRENKGIRLTDNIFKLLEDPQAPSLVHEVEARWRLVETAWELNVSRHLIHVSYDDEQRVLYMQKNSSRVDVTSCRDALNGYQKGHCFYCFDPIHIEQGHEKLADVDHFFAHSLKYSDSAIGASVDGVWNLVLACQECNRGEGGKFAKVPALTLLNRLSARNDFLISSHHPLRETLMQQTGKSPESRTAFLQSAYAEGKRVLLHEWEPEQKGPAVF